MNETVPVNLFVCGFFEAAETTKLRDGRQVSPDRHHIPTWCKAYLGNRSGPVCTTR